MENKLSNKDALKMTLWAAVVLVAVAVIAATFHLGPWATGKTTVASLKREYGGHGQAYGRISHKPIIPQK